VPPIVSAGLKCKHEVLHWPDWNVQYLRHAKLVPSSVVQE
jgi:hypothetical protein